MTKAIYLCYGDDEPRVTAKAREILSTLCPKGQELESLEIVPAACENSDDVLACLKKTMEAMRTVSMFNPLRIVWMQSVSFLSGAGVLSADAKEAIGCFAEEMKKTLPPDTYLVISANGVDKRSLFYKAVEKVAELHYFELPKQEKMAEKAALDFLQNQLAKREIRASSEALSAFVERSGFDARQIENEVFKLDIYLGERRQMELQDVLLLVAPVHELTGWELADLAGNRKLSEAVHMVDQLLEQRISEVQLISGLAGRFRELSLYRQALDSGAAQLKGSYRYTNLVWKSPEAESETLEKIGKGKVHPYRQMLLAQQAGKFTESELARARKRIADTHDQLFRSSMPTNLQIQFLLIQILSNNTGV